MELKSAFLPLNTKKKRSPFLMRIMVLNLCSLLLVSFFNYAAFYTTSNRAFLENVAHYNVRVSELAFRNIDEQIFQSMAKVSSIYFSDLPSNAALLRPQREDISQMPEAIHAFSEKLREIFNACPSASGIDIYYENTGTVCTGGGNLHFTQSPQERDLYLPWYRAFSESGRNSLVLYSDAGVYPYTEKGSYGAAVPTISYITKIFNPRWIGHEFIVAVHTPSLGFSRYIDEAQGQLVISDESGNVIYATPGKAVSAQAIVTQALSQPGSTLQVEGSDFVISRTPATSLGLQYYYAVPHNIFVQSYSAQLRALIVSYIISVLFTLAVLLCYSYISNAAYRKRIVSASRKAGLEIAENPDSFDSSVEVITDQLSSLNTVVKQTRPIVYRNYCRSLISGRHTDHIFEQVAPALVHKGLFCFVLHFFPTDATVMDLEAVRLALNEADDTYLVLLTALEQNEIAVLVNVDEEQAEAVRKTVLKRFDTIFNSYYAADGIWCSLSEAAFRQCYESAYQGYRYHFIFPALSYLSYHEIGTAALKSTGSHLKIFALLEKDIRSENLLNLKQRLQDLTESFKFGGYSIDYCLSTLRDLAALLCNIAQSFKLDMWVIFGYDIRAYCEQITDIDEYYRWICDIAEVLMQNLRQRKKNIDPDLHGRLVELINQNLENDISLDFLADQVHLRSDVLSRTFKQLLGKSYIDYIKEKKLLRAKELIAEGLSMQQIAQRLGYNSTQYFIKIFKETYGLTPYQYKKASLQENTDPH